MSIISIVGLAIGCLLVNSPLDTCMATEVITVTPKEEPRQTGPSLDVVLSAKAALVWDENSGKVLYSKEADKERPIASLNKLVSLLAVRLLLTPETIVEIPPEVRIAQKKGADVGLPPGQHASVQDLLAASAIPSANDAMLTLAIAAKGSEAAFVEYANEFAAKQGLFHTKLINATGLQGGLQYSTASDVQRMLTLASADPILAPLLGQKNGIIHTQEGYAREYKTTDLLLGSYLPIIMAKTGYTIEAGENLAILTKTKSGHTIGGVVLGSANRFHDMKVLVEWIERNYTW